MFLIYQRWIDASSEEPPVVVIETRDMETRPESLLSRKNAEWTPFWLWV